MPRVLGVVRVHPDWRPRSPGPRLGEIQRPKPWRGFRRVVMECGENEPTLWWDRDGNLYRDRELREPAGLAIVALLGVDDG